MDNTVRKIERSVVKKQLERDARSVKKGFENAWKEYREKKYVVKDEEGNIVTDSTPKNTMPKKQKHFDNVEQYTKMFTYFDQLKEKSKEKKQESTVEE